MLYTGTIGLSITLFYRRGSGQSVMVYPVYKDTDSEPKDFKYYIHSLKI